MNWLPRIFHRHDFQKVSGTMEPCGITLGWDILPTTEYQMLARCKCGVEQIEKGLILPRGFEEISKRINEGIEK